jgi:hypothetical protein
VTVTNTLAYHVHSLIKTVKGSIVQAYDFAAKIHMRVLINNISYEFLTIYFRLSLQSCSGTFIIKLIMAVI